MQILPNFTWFCMSLTAWHSFVYFNLSSPRYQRSTRDFWLTRACRLCTGLSRDYLFQLIESHYMILYNLCTSLDSCQLAYFSCTKRSFRVLLFHNIMVQQFLQLSCCRPIEVTLGLCPHLTAYQPLHRSWVIHVGFVH